MPANLHFKELNPHIDVEDFPVTFPTEVVQLEKETALVAGLSSFGFGGTNAHVVLGEAPASSAAPKPTLTMSPTGTSPLVPRSTFRQRRYGRRSWAHESRHRGRGRVHR